MLIDRQTDTDIYPRSKDTQVALRPPSSLSFISKSHPTPNKGSQAGLYEEMTYSWSRVGKI